MVMKVIVRSNVFPEALLLLLAFLLVQHWPVLVYHVALEVTGLCASIITLATFVWLFSSVSEHVNLQTSSLAKGLFTLCTFV